MILPVADLGCSCTVQYRYRTTSTYPKTSCGIILLLYGTVVRIFYDFQHKPNEKGKKSVDSTVQYSTVQYSTVGYGTVLVNGDNLMTQ